MSISGNGVMLEYHQKTDYAVQYKLRGKEIFRESDILHLNKSILALVNTNGSR
jgi:hypothetical protein